MTSTSNQGAEHFCHVTISQSPSTNWVTLWPRDRCLPYLKASFWDVLSWWASSIAAWQLLASRAPWDRKLCSSQAVVSTPAPTLLSYSQSEHRYLSWTWHWTTHTWHTHSIPNLPQCYWSSHDKVLGPDPQWRWRSTPPPDTHTHRSKVVNSIVNNHEDLPDEPISRWRRWRWGESNVMSCFTSSVSLPIKSILK